MLKMAARTCLHCGKALVFMRMGAGGDFCSREHRNQYQLQRGMGRLAEANKVATLARRRETPKALFSEPAGSPAGAGRMHQEPAAFPNRAGTVVWPLRKLEHELSLPENGVLGESAAQAAMGGVRREFGSRVFSPGKPVYGGARTPLQTISGLDASPAGWLRGPKVEAAAGNALRISSSVGFQAKRRGAKIGLSGRRTGGLKPAAMEALTRPRAFSLSPNPRPAPADARLAFLDYGFAPDSQASPGWANADAPAQERRV